MVRTRRAETVSHDQFRAQLAELALGLLQGRQQTCLLQHVAYCGGCAAHLQDLVTVADGLLWLLAPEVDPPIGFDRRVWERARLVHA